MIFFKGVVNGIHRVCHVGIITKVDGSYIYTIEGNTGSSNNTVQENGGGVFTKRYTKGNSRIAYFCRPAYDKKSVDETPKSETTKPKPANNMYVVKRGDSLSKIAYKFLGNVNRYKEIMKLNNLKTTNIDIGQKIKIPKK